ncbi:phospholipid carrier-dependent glycosyltransferase [Synechococcus sp. CS-1324]|uniref:phospholipid carrier-dependent glycosyltransferase n=1 Tax=Synechococcus sp. CS-1324 TaxID=2847980 RepID=UPI000DB18E57|nr:phospholipid carrier-dependent glycosyltransferase [Synechococcus sp. CS-1324]MCT0230428.1 phospholipid carrier-dependent glycosyltransferase [Synechococcus sp. CS-1324]PZV01717.1 MAG: 4-amino-4-deoxy-L-arabinose transferase [Cyanobium sp.]
MEAISPGPRPPTVPWRGLLLLWAVALILAGTGLGNLPLRDWDEGIVARVSLEIADRGLPRGLLPTLWGDPYLNKPPGLHLLIAETISLWRQASSAAAAGLPPEWVMRLAPALLSTLVVPLVGLVQCQLRPGQRGAALATAAVMLTLLPVARHGRLAMLDGPQLSAMAMLWWALLRSRSSGHSALREGGMAGLAGSALLLLKAPVLLPALAAGLIGLAADPSPGRRRWGQLLIGLVLGLGPGLAWHLWHGWSRGGAALWLWGGDGVTRVLLDAGEGSELGWRVPLIELLEGGWPWLPLWPMALVIAWRQRSMPWGRWCLVLQLVLAASILPLRTQLPWYSHPLWLPFALLCGPLLARLLQPRQDRPPLRFVPILWSVLGGGLVVLALLAATGRTGLPGEASRLVLPAGLGLLVGGLMLLRPTARQRRSGLALLLAGWCFSLLLLFQSSLWNWELNEQDDVRPLASLARAAETGADTGLLPIYVAGQSGRRPSLNWYAQRPIDPLPSRASSGTPTPFLLLAKASTPPPPLLLEPGSHCRLSRLGDQDWQLWRCTVVPLSDEPLR